MKKGFERILSCVKLATPSAMKTIWWLAKIMVCISFAIMLLQYFGIIHWISCWLTPVFSHFGLPGEAALAYVTGYFVNCYSAIAVMTTLDLSSRSITILSVMVMCSHNMIIETTVQHKTGSSVLKILLIRTFSAFFLAWVLNRIMPFDPAQLSSEAHVSTGLSFLSMFSTWALSTLKNVLLMLVLVYLLTLLQRILTEFGVIQFISKGLKPIMLFFGLPANTAFLWLVANTLGLAYGAAIMIDESENGHTTKTENDLLNHHISISHSNLEDILLFTAIGGSFIWMLLSRWAMSIFWVWERRLENKLKSLRQSKSILME